MITDLHDALKIIQELSEKKPYDNSYGTIIHPPSKKTVYFSMVMAKYICESNWQIKDINGFSCDEWFDDEIKFVIKTNGDFGLHISVCCPHDIGEEGPFLFTLLKESGFNYDGCVVDIMTGFFKTKKINEELKKEFKYIYKCGYKGIEPQGYKGCYSIKK